MTTIALPQLQSFVNSFIVKNNELFDHHCFAGQLESFTNEFITHEQQNLYHDHNDILEAFLSDLAEKQAGYGETFSPVEGISGDNEAYRELFPALYDEAYNTEVLYSGGMYSAHDEAIASVEIALLNGDIQFTYSKLHKLIED